MPDKKKQVMLVEDHRLFRNVLKQSLEKDITIQVVAETDSGQKALELVKSIPVDVIFMDINLSDPNGIESTRRILKENPQVKIIGLSMHKNINYVRGMLEAGASGYLIKTSSGKIMSEAVTAVLSGKNYFCPETQCLFNSP